MAAVPPMPPLLGDRHFPTSPGYSPPLSLVFLMCITDVCGSKSYMESKNRKLRDQFDADVSTSSIGSVSEDNRLSDTSGDKGIFHGVSIFVDGYTVPSHQV